MSAGFDIRADLTDPEWDAWLTALRGHPLQSAHWTRAREETEGRRYRHVAVVSDGQVAWMARAESRRLPLLGDVAWLPRGPASWASDGPEPAVIGRRALADLGFVICMGTPWRRSGDLAGAPGPRTIWLDLTQGRDRLWSGLQKKWRHGVGFARRAGVEVVETRDPQRVAEFFQLCQSVSAEKGFTLPATEPLLLRLIESSANGPVTSHLFLAIYEEHMAAGAFVIRCGQHIHYFWGGTDRGRAAVRPGELLHWSIIEWGLSQGCTLYDLEGIDPVGNPGTYEFKRKMGGEEVQLAARETIALSWPGRLIAPVVSRLVA